MHGTARPGRDTLAAERTKPLHETDLNGSGAGRFVGGRSRTLNIIGYARVSTRDQDTQYQEHAHTSAGASRVFTDHGDSSRIRDRPQWVACLDYMRAGDTLLIHRLDRVSGEWHLFQLISELADRGINIRSLTEP